MSQTENAFSQFVSKKAYEICYALFRVASQVKRQSFADYLEGQGLDLLESALSGDSHTAGLASMTLEYLLRIGADVNILNSSNAQVIISELRQFNAAVAELEKAAKVDSINLDDVFSKLPIPIENRRTAQPEVRLRSPQAVQPSSPQALSETKNGDTVQNQSRTELSHSHTNSESGANGNSNGIIRSAMRKSAILEIIRQNGNCRLKDIQDTLPDISERTIRYDIQNLIGQGLVERIGSGGPDTSYKSRN